jgi:hypothetical protein
MASHSESSSGSEGFLVNRPSSVRILVAEDPFVVTFLRTVLQRRGHKVISGEAVASGDLLRERQITADMVITNRPDAFLDFAPWLPLLYLASDPDQQLARHFSHCRVLRKPFRNEELLAAVEQLACCVVP